ncbi:hypothetical protein TTRE_0000909101 [Trichuris trichiura]|uniref:Protein kinase domain-containing protein n=1 Tax=Trichuris trichiura TaxID=36087 RepID=A0A077ZPN6_TRITR|nr:hypothetical protein TTRE_0000909101 [Trichuris trichiura]
MQSVRCVQGKYPRPLQEAWDTFAMTNSTEKQRPNEAQDSQHYLLIYVEHDAVTFDKFQYTKNKHTEDLVRQLVLTLCILEKKYKFEHRDLHAGNILINFHNVRLCGEAGSADADTAQTFPTEVKNLVKEKVTTEELQELSVAGEAEGREEDDENQEVPPSPPQQMTTAELSDTLEATQQRLQWLEDNDCNAERSGKTTRSIRACLEPYKQLLYERSTCAKQKKLEFYFTAMKKHCDDEEALRSASNRTSVRP